MADRKSRFEIELSIENADNVRQSISDIESRLKNISESAKDSLGEGLKTASKEAEKLAEEIKNVAKSGEASAEQIEAYNKAAEKTIQDLEKQSSKLTYSLSEQGKAQRDRLKLLENELKSLGNSREEMKRRKELEKEIKNIQKDVVVGSDEELKNALKTNRATRATLKLAQQESKLLQAQTKSNKTLSELIKSDLKSLKDKIALQLKFIQTLKTTEGRYNAIKKAGSAILKAGAVGIGAAVGGAMALGGAAVASANAQVDREREATRIKASLSDEEKQSLLGQLYTTTGADYTTIVDAINRVTSVLGTNAKESDLVQATTAEIRYPGAAAMFRQQNTKQANANDFAIYQNRLKAIQSASGASIDQVKSSTEKIANMRQSSFSNASMTELQALYLGLQNSGAYDSQDELDRAFNSFVRNQKDSGKSVFDYAKDFDWTARAYGATNKRQTINAMANMDWDALSNAAKVTSSENSMTAAEKTAMKMRELEEAKNKILMKVLEAILPVIEAIDVKELQKFFESFIEIAKTVAPVIGKLVTMLFDVLQKLSPYISKIVTFMSETLEMLIDSVNALYQAIANSKIGSWLGLAENKGVSGQAHSNGGLAMMPSICGEAGAEMVVPLDWSRNARAANLVQNLTQNFTMQGNETSLLSLSAAVRSREFARETGRLNYFNARMGR